MPEYCPFGQPFRFAPGLTAPVGPSTCSDGVRSYPCYYNVRIEADGEGPFYSSDPSAVGYDPMTGDYLLVISDYHLPDFLLWNIPNSPCLQYTGFGGIIGGLGLQLKTSLVLEEGSIWPVTAWYIVYAMQTPGNAWSNQEYYIEYQSAVFYSSPEWRAFGDYWTDEDEAKQALASGNFTLWHGNKWRRWIYEEYPDFASGWEITVESERCSNLTYQTAYFTPVSSPVSMCCQKSHCYSHYVQQTDSNGIYQGSCCLKAKFAGVLPGKLNVARFGAGADMPSTDSEDYPDLNPTLLLKHTRCTLGDPWFNTSGLDLNFGTDYYETRPASVLVPCPTELKISGNMVVFYSESIDLGDGYGETYDDRGWEMELMFSGTEKIETEQQSSPVENRVVFRAVSEPADIQRGATVDNRCIVPGEQYRYEEHRSGTFSGPPLKPDFFPVTLTFDSEQSTSYDSQTWRGPDYRNATVTIGVANCSFGGCNNPPVCTPLMRVPAWMLSTTDMFGNRRTRRMLPRGNRGIWKHARDHWQLFAESSARDFACLLRLLISLPKYDHNFTWAIPSEADPCELDDGDPWPMSLWLTENIPLDPASREHYLSVGLRPGSAITATPWCDDEEPPPDDSIEVDGASCLPETWTVIIDSVEYTLVYILPGDPANGGYWRYPAVLDLADPPPTIVTLVRIANDPGPPATSRFALTFNTDWNEPEWKYDTNLWARSGMLDVDWDGGADCCEADAGDGFMHLGPDADYVEGLPTEIEFVATPDCGA